MERKSPQKKRSYGVKVFLFSSVGASHHALRDLWITHENTSSSSWPTQAGKRRYEELQLHKSIKGQAVGATEHLARALKHWTAYNLLLFAAKYTRSMLFRSDWAVPIFSLPTISTQVSEQWTAKGAEDATGGREASRGIAGEGPPFRGGNLNGKGEARNSPIGCIEMFQCLCKAWKETRQWLSRLCFLGVVLWSCYLVLGSLFDDMIWHR